MLHIAMKNNRKFNQLHTFTSIHSKNIGGFSRLKQLILKHRGKQSFMWGFTMWSSLTQDRHTA